MQKCFVWHKKDWSDTTLSFSGYHCETGTCLCNIKAGFMQLAVIWITRHNESSTGSEYSSTTCPTRSATWAYKPALEELHWLPVRQRINYKILLMTYKALNGMAPEFISDLIQLYVSARSLRSSSGSRLEVPCSVTKFYGERAYASTAAHLWNSLPNNICQAPSLTIFKSLLKTHLFRQHFLHWSMISFVILILLFLMDNFAFIMFIMCGQIMFVLLILCITIENPVFYCVFVTEGDVLATSPLSPGLQPTSSHVT